VFLIAANREINELENILALDLFGPRKRSGLMEEPDFSKQ